MRSNAEAGFRPAIYLALKGDEGLRSQVITELCDDLRESVRDRRLR